MRPVKILSAFLAGGFLISCSLAPPYKKPDIAVPSAYKEGDAAQGRWQLSSATAGKPDDKAWWTIFNDMQLNQLEQLAVQENNSLQAAAARLQQSRAALRRTTADFYPQINATANASRSDLGGNVSPQSNFSIGADIAYDANTLLQIRDAATGSKANVLANEALYRQALLMVQADVADNYYALLSLDTERDLLRKSIDLRVESQKLIERRFREGEAGEQDFLRSQAETAATQADLKALDQQRAVREHALSVLVGKTPADFSLQETALPHELPRIPAGLPSSLLERRPDVAAAEQRMIQTNAQIGIARSAFFPSLLLTASGGLASDDLGDVFKWSSRSWALGPLYGTALSLPLFDAGRRLAGVDLAKANFQEAVSNYREQVLVAFKDVEDSLSAIRLQAEQAQHLYRSADAATKAARISDLRYKEGETGYLDVLDTQRDTLAVQRAYTEVQGARFRSTIGLIRALGGGWFSAAPDLDQTTEPTVGTDKAVTKETVPETPKTRKTQPVPNRKASSPSAAPLAKQTQAEQPPAPTTQQRDFEDINPSILFD